ncbi:hypothetical protein Patl1_33519 [Pistacia atlantica]|uniref:Uncharacterized protein n=1 Tax=Pistacia atlantica TaxID=434234 RepID=A0ACC0ZQF9_9ROSI|nr:hypothetical protein Patl1_33519 [Pistacia atlantica]
MYHLTRIEYGVDQPERGTHKNIYSKE